MITLTFVLVLIMTSSTGSVSITTVHEMVYEQPACDMAGMTWIKSGAHRDYFCLPTAAVKEDWLKMLGR